MPQTPAMRLSLAALADAQSQGAAPGAEGAHATRSASRGASRRQTKRVFAIASALLAAIGFASLATAGWLHAKAQLGQWLLVRAWNATRREGGPVRPWPWADLHPVARLVVPGRQVDVLVLAGANGRTLAWGPGHDERSARPGNHGNAVVTGHRDTHFAFLRTLAVGDAVVVEDPLGLRTTYRVREVRVVDRHALRLPTAKSVRRLTLVTCYPFDAVLPDTPWRYVVLAEGDDRDAHASLDDPTREDTAAGASSIARSRQAVNASTNGARPSSP